jgi:hypothetical protein
MGDNSRKQLSQKDIKNIREPTIIDYLSNKNQ